MRPRNEPLYRLADQFFTHITKYLLYTLVYPKNLPVIVNEEYPFRHRVNEDAEC